MLLDHGRYFRLIKGLLDETIGDGGNMLQYANATIFLLKDGFNSTNHFKLALCEFEQMFANKNVHDFKKVFGENGKNVFPYSRTTQTFFKL